MKRPCWTVCLCILWVLILPATILVHVSVSGILPAIQDLPANIVVGFDDIFGFKQLESESNLIKTEAETAIGKCTCSGGLCTSASCAVPGVLATLVQHPSFTVDTSIQKANIDAAFDRTLNRVQSVTNDPYLGTSAFSDTNRELKKIKDTVASVPPNGPCLATVTSYCSIRTSANAIVDGISAVNNEIDKFKTSDAVESWENSSSMLIALHLMPYTLLIGMAFFTAFWWFSNGICCCCEGGSMSGLCFVPLFLLFLLAAEVVWGIVVFTGFLVTTNAKNIKVEALNGDPDLDTVCQHFILNFPAFWAKTFKDIYDNLPLLYRCGIVFTFVTEFIGLYALLVCCCCPYRGTEDSKGAVQGQVVGNADSAVTPIVPVQVW